MNFQDKALLHLHDQPLIEHVIASARKQVDSMDLTVISKFRNVLVDIDKVQAGYFLNMNSEELLATARKHIKRKHQS